MIIALSLFELFVDGTWLFEKIDMVFFAAAWICLQNRSDKSQFKQIVLIVWLSLNECLICDKRKRTVIDFEASPANSVVSMIFYRILFLNDEFK